MGTNNPGVIRGMAAARSIIDPDDLNLLVQAAVEGALAGALAGKADLISGVVPDEQLPSRLSDTEIQTLANNAAATATAAILTARNLPPTSFATSVALGDDSTAENQIQTGARHIELAPSTQPLAPSTGARLWVETIAGKNTLKVLFPTGTALTLATEP